MKTLAELMAWLKLSAGLQNGADKPIVALSQQTAQLQPGWAFVALAGQQGHGADYWREAQAQGALCILSDRLISEADVPVLFVADLAQRLSDLACWFYDTPQQKLTLIGVTGTNGKTSTTHYIAQMLTALGEPTGVLGTLGNGVYPQLTASANTTADVLSLQYWLSRFVAQGVRWVAMEVSSHGIALGRIKGLAFSCVALTQVTRDHLDFHLDEADYRAVKARLFEQYPSQQRVLNVDDGLGRELAARLPAFSYSRRSQADLTAQALHLDSEGLAFNLHYQQQHWRCRAHLMGAFNVENLLCALSCLLALGWSMARLQPLIAKVYAVNGRMQPVALKRKAIGVLVDYAHTADALEQVLLAVRAHVQQGRLWVVFGCGGDRDRGKRPLMGEVAARCADVVVLTSDNPRSEDPLHIMQQIAQGMNKPAEQIVSRQAAIEFALQNALPGDVVVVAGKGHETTQIIQGVTYPFSDQEGIKRWDNQV
jgi:UDP-N-acetylmuramoyl-L-alanyl-D-glutamate--2,6-diaminopimelate ligase